MDKFEEKNKDVARERKVNVGVVLRMRATQTNDNQGHYGVCGKNKEFLRVFQGALRSS